MTGVQQLPMTDNITIRMYSGKEEARKRQLEDPIVFKANEIGAIIATMWDTEATDSIFDKYRQLINPPPVVNKGIEMTRASPMLADELFK